ncbi:MAG: Ig-like domain-containing protein, partial [Methylococcaceae bacterium]
MTYVNKYISVSLLLLAAMILTGGGVIPRAEAGGGPGPIPLSIPIEASTDDAEENLNDGDMSLASSDLELIQDGVKPQKIGLRFPLDIPVDATIISAYIQFTVDETSSVATNLTVHGQAIANALTFSHVDFDISNRTLTTASVTWAPLAWNTKGLAGPDQQTPDLSVIVQQVVDLGAWAQGNYIAFIISGNGKRVAETFNGTAAPVLHVEYTTEAVVPAPPDAVNDDTFAAPAYTTGQDVTLTVLDGENDIVERNDDLGSPVAVVSTFGSTTGAETVVSALGTTSAGGALVVQVNGSFVYTPPSGYTGVDSFVYTLTNSAGSDTAVVYISVQEVSAVETIWVPVATGTDDAEENLSSGSVSLSSSDLEMVRDGSKEQVVGVRFRGVNIPQGAAIVDAYIQYTSDEVNSEATNLVIRGQNSANPATFTTIKLDISSRPLTASQVSWLPVPWTTNEQSNAIQATPNIKDIVQELVDQVGWSSGNAMVFITSGTGKRVAESFNGTAAPMLHITYATESAPPEPPVAVDDGSMAVPAYVTDIDTALVVADGANDIVERNDDVGNPAATVIPNFVGTANGVVSINADGSFSYTPNLGFIGVDSFNYTLTNGELPDSTATVYISVKEVGPVNNTVWLSVATGNDDAEERISSGSVSLSSSDLEMVRDGVSEQIVGVRFQGLNIPQAATIVEAYLQFKVDETSSEATNLVIRGQDSANAAIFTTTRFDLSSRSLTSTPVAWAALPVWGTASANQQSPDISAIVQEVVNLGGWASGNPIAFIISGTGKRVAESYNGTSAPELHVTYSTDPVLLEAPIAVDDNFTTAMDTPVAGDLFLNDDLGFPVAKVDAFDGNSVQGSGFNVTVAEDGSFTYTPPVGFLGPDSFTYTLKNGEASNSTATVFIEVENLGEEGVLWIPVITGSDDAEEDTNSGSVNTSSSDLEMILDRTKVQIVGVRFQNINIPDEALITEAYIQYQVDEDTSEQTDLIVHGELSSNAATYNNVNSNISVRATTSKSVTWPVPAWNTRGQAGPDQRTPDISEIVQEIIDQIGWVSGNSIAFITSGTGNRVA